MSRSLALTYVFLLSPLLLASQATEQELYGTVQRVDASKFTITLTYAIDGEVQDRTLDVIKKAKITVNGSPGLLADVRPGQNVKLDFNKELEVVTRIEASGEGIAEPEWASLNELQPPKTSKGSPWLSEDGLTLFWKAVPPGDERPWIYQAMRKSPMDFFEESTRLLPGNDPTLTSDGREMILLFDSKLHVSTRSSVGERFQRARLLSELGSHGFLAGGCITGDGLRLYADRLDFEKKTVELVVSTRTSRARKWSPPEPLQFEGIDNPRQRFFSITADGKYAFTSLQQTDGDWETSRIVVWLANNDGKTFHSPCYVEVDGVIAEGKFPRYVQATKELFVSKHRKDNSKQEEIWVLRQFDPTLHTRPVNAK